MGQHDDLEKLLTDLDEQSDYEVSRDQSLKDSERRARRGDSPGPDDDAASSVLTTEQYVEQFGEDILFFKSGMTSVLNEHLRFTAEFKKLFSDSQIPRDVDDIIKKYRYTYLKYLENIEDYVTQFERQLSPDALLRESKKDYHKKFQGYEDENRLNFLVLKDIFLRLREFNSLVKKEWSDLAKSIDVINLSSSGRAYFVELSTHCASAVDFCRRTDAFLHFIASVLSIPDDEFDVLDKEILNKIRYHDGFSYQYENLFRSKKEDEQSAMRRHDDALQLDAYSAPAAAEPDEDAAVDDRPAEMPLRRSAPEPEPEDEPAHAGEPGAAAPARSSFTPAVEFTVKGTRSWNTREPYVIKLNVEALESDYRDLGSSFFYIDRPDSEQSLRGDIKIAMIKYLRDRSQNVVEAYRGFIHHVIRDAAAEAGSFFSLTGERHHLFLYHLGPLTISRVVSALFQARSVGSCYKYVEGNVIKRFMPAEFIRESALIWCEHFVNNRDLPFDRIQEFDELRKMVARKYHSEIERVLGIINKVDTESKLGKKSEAEKLDIFRERWNQWFGPVPMAIYRRFVEKSLLR